MQITAFTDYALRVLIHLSVHGDDRGLCTIRDIAEVQRVSENHLMKVVHRLGRHGYVETVRGNRGGLRLARAPETIVIGDVVRRFEENMALVECFSGAGERSCRIEPACVLKGAFGRALGAFLRELDTVTLADIAAPRQALKAALAL